MASKVLIIDDDHWTRQALEEILIRAGFLVHSLTSGDGLEELLGREEFAIALIDYHLPWRNGLEIARLLKSRQAACRTVLISSAFQVAQQADKMAGVIDRFLAKPFSRSQLLGLLAELQAPTSA